MGLNLTIIEGRMTRDVEVRTTKNGTSVANFTVAVDSSRKNADGSRNTLFQRCVAWGKRGETIATYFKKGAPIIVQGELEQRTYTNRQNVEVTVTELNVNGLDFPLSSRNNNQEQLANQQSVPSQPTVDPFADNSDSVEIDDNDLPF